MATLTERPSTGLLVVDARTAVMAGGHNRDDVFAGAPTGECIRSMLHGAIVRGVSCG
jgi:hypothetical protein